MTKAELIEKLQNTRREYASDSDYYDAYDWAIRMAEKLDDPPMLQNGKDGMFYPCPIPAQQEPSVLEVALRMMSMDSGLHWEAAVADAWAMVDLSKAEEARRAGE